MLDAGVCVNGVGPTLTSVLRIPSRLVQVADRIATLLLDTGHIIVWATYQLK